MTNRTPDAREHKHLVTPSPTPSRDVLPQPLASRGRKYRNYEDYFYTSQEGYSFLDQNPAQDIRYLTPEPRAYSPFAQDRQATTVTPPVYRGATPGGSPTPYSSPDSRSRGARTSAPVQPKGVKGSKVSKKTSQRSNQSVSLPSISFSKQLSQAAWSAVKTKTMAHIQRPSGTRQADQVNKKGCVKRPWNTYVIYRWAFSSLIKALYPGSGQQDVSRVASTSWKLEPSEVKDFFSLMADKEKSEHKKAFPYYSYQPNKPNDVPCSQRSRATSAGLETEGVEWHEAPRRASRSISCGPAITDVPCALGWDSRNFAIMPSVEEAFYDNSPVPAYLDAPPMQTSAHDTNVNNIYEKGSINPSLLHDSPYFIGQANETAYPPLPPVDHLIGPYHEGIYASGHSSMLYDGLSIQQGYSVADMDSFMDPDDWECHLLSLPDEED